MTSNERPADWLTRYAFGARLSPAARETLIEAASRFSAPAGTVILDEGATCDPVVFLERGTIRVYKRTAQGREITLYRVRPGQICVVAVTSVLGERPYAATAAVSEAIRGTAIPVEIFRRVFSAEPPLQRFIMRQVAERLATVMTAVVEVGFQNLDRRLARFLLDAGAVGGRGAVELSHEEIAGELGTAREVVTRVLDAFETDGLVRLGRRRIDLSKISELRDLASGERK